MNIIIAHGVSLSVLCQPILANSIYFGQSVQYQYNKHW